MGWPVSKLLHYKAQFVHSGAKVNLRILASSLHHARHVLRQLTLNSGIESGELYVEKSSPDDRRVTCPAVYSIAPLGKKNPHPARPETFSLSQVAAENHAASHSRLDEYETAGE
jgi:hypothetical protein